MPYSHVTRTAYGADAIAYARGHGTGHNGDEARNIFVAGVNMLPDEIVPFEDQMQPLWDKADPRHKTQINRFIVSFATSELDPDDPGDLGKAMDIGCELARANAPDCQSAVFVQTDGKGHKVHIHILTNDVTLKGYKGIDSEAYAHWHLKPLVDKICSRYFTLAQPEAAPERITRAVRGARIANEQIRVQNSKETDRAIAEGRPVDHAKMRPEKYIWQDDLRARIRRAAAQAWDEDSFARVLRADGVELLEQRQKDGTVSYVHRATRTMPEYYVYELIDVSGFPTGEKIPANLKSRSCKMGTDYAPDGISRLFRQVRREAPPPEIAVDVHGIVASAGKPEQEQVKHRELTPQEKDRLALEHAVELAKQYVLPILKLVYPEADDEWADQLYDQFIRWRDARRKKYRQKGQVYPPIYRKGENGEGGIVAEDLDQQYRAFLAEWKATEAARELERIQRERMALAADIMQIAETVEREREARMVEIG